MTHPSTRSSSAGYPVLRSQRAHPKWLTVADVARELNCSKMTVYRLIHNDGLPAIRVGRGLRIAEHVLDRFIGDADISPWTPDEDGVA